MPQVISEGLNSIFYTAVADTYNPEIFNQEFNVIPYTPQRQQVYVNYFPPLWDPFNDTFLRVFLNNAFVARVKIVDEFGFIYTTVNPPYGHFNITVKSDDLLTTYASNEFISVNLNLFYEVFGKYLGEQRIEIERVKGDLFASTVRDEKIYTNFGSFINFPQPQGFTIDEYRRFILGNLTFIGNYRAKFFGSTVKGFKEAVGSITNAFPILTTQSARVGWRLKPLPLRYNHLLHQQILSGSLLTFSSGLIRIPHIDYLESTVNLVHFKTALTTNTQVQLFKLPTGLLWVRYTKTAVGGETLVTVPFSYTTGNGSLLVFKNGLLLTLATDYTETSSTQVTFTTPLSASDSVQFIKPDGTGLSIDRQVYTAAGGETVVVTSFPYAIANGLFVTRAGSVKLINKDYKETTTTSVTFSTPLSPGEKVQFLVIKKSGVPWIRFHEITQTAKNDIEPSFSYTRSHSKTISLITKKYRRLIVFAQVVNSFRQVTDEPIVMSAVDGTDFLLFNDLAHNLVNITQGITTYYENVDFIVDRANGSITWLNGQPQPAIDSTYLVDYFHIPKDVVEFAGNAIKPAHIKVIYDYI